jgi:hypothetical protein
MAVAVLCAVGSAPSAVGFGTVNALGQNAEHEKITRRALSDFGKKTLDEIAGNTGSFGAVGAPDNPTRGLMSEAAAHCDGGDYLASPPAPASPAYPQSKADAAAKITACRAYIMAALNKAVEAAAPLADPGVINTSLGCSFTGSPGRAKCNVLEQLGLAFHASQDFYSHSNWTDRAAPVSLSAANPPGLGNSGRAPWLDPRRETPFPNGLITGCYDGFPESAYCEYAQYKRIKHDALNKDTGQIPPSGKPTGTTARGAVNDNFERAVDAAVDDTRDKWRYFEERVVAVYGAEKGKRIACVVKNDDRSKCK